MARSLITDIIIDTLVAALPRVKDFSCLRTLAVRSQYGVRRPDTEKCTLKAIGIKPWLLHLTPKLGLRRLTFTQRNTNIFNEYLYLTKGLVHTSDKRRISVISCRRRVRCEWRKPPFRISTPRFAGACKASLGPSVELSSHT